MLSLDVLTLHVVEAHISGFSHDGIPERSAVVLLDHPLDCGIANDTDAERVGNQDRSLEDAVFVYPVRAGHVAIAVAGIEGGKDAFA